MLAANGGFGWNHFPKPDKPSDFFDMHQSLRKALARSTIFLFHFSEFLLILIPFRARKRGASRSSRVLGAGCGGRIASSDVRCGADGQVVWS
jgi:hypothetical protein